jgi:hypothetical protein
MYSTIQLLSFVSIHVFGLEKKVKGGAIKASTLISI